MSGANVKSIDVVDEFRSVYLTTADTIREALVSVEMESRRMLDWLQHEQVYYWESEKRRRWEDLSEAKAALSRKQLGRRDGHQPDVTEEKENLRICHRRLDEAEDKLENLKKWSREVQRALDEYQGHGRRLADLVEGDPPPGVVALNKMLKALEAYLAITAPTSGSPVGGAVGGVTGVTGAAPTSSTTGGTPAATPAAGGGKPA